MKGLSQRPTTKVNSSGDDMASLPGFDVREFADDGVLVHRSLHGSCSRDCDHAERVQIFGSVAFTAACCYAKSAPVALRRGDAPQTGKGLVRSA